MIVQSEEKVKLFTGVLYSCASRLDSALTILGNCYSAVDYRSSDFEFTVSDYYIREMGTPLKRCFLSFTDLIMPQQLPEIKLTCNEIEQHLSENGKRRVNLDPGYLDFDKMVLASVKYNGQKIMLDHGIWADLTLRYEKGLFRTYPWSFPDFKTGLYNEALLSIRRIYKQQIKSSD